jgi:hypothetical protein
MITMGERFWAKVNKDGPVPQHCPERGPCWTWTASCYPNGYGQFSVKAGMIVPAHRVAWMLSNGSMPDGLLVCHHCDNHVCVNPAHLFLCTHEDNMQDMVAKGRQVKMERHWAHLHPEKRATGERHGSRTHPESVPRGEQHRWAKMDRQKVRTIRERYAAGGVTQYALAAEYGVDQNTIWKIVNGETWKEAR